MTYGIVEKIVIATLLYIIVGLYVGAGIWVYTVSYKRLGSYLKHFLRCIFKGLGWPIYLSYKVARVVIIKQRRSND